MAESLDALVDALLSSSRAKESAHLVDALHAARAHGARLPGVPYEFLHRLLVDADFGVLNYAPAPVRAAIVGVAALISESLQGHPPPALRWANAQAQAQRWSQGVDEAQSVVTRHAATVAFFAAQLDAAGAARWAWHLAAVADPRQSLAAAGAMRTWQISLLASLVDQAIERNPAAGRPTPLPLARRSS